MGSAQYQESAVTVRVGVREDLFIKIPATFECGLVLDVEEITIYFVCLHCAHHPTNIDKSEVTAVALIQNIDNKLHLIRMKWVWVCGRTVADGYRYPR